MSKNVLVTGAGGFVGHHFVEHVLRNTDWDIVATDSFRHRGKTSRLYEVMDAEYDGVDFQALEGASVFIPPSYFERTKIFTHDLCAPFTAQQIRKLQSFGVDYMVCFASESHVDRSISDPVPFVRNNSEVCLNTLELARKLRPKNLIWISTDEVYGPVAADDLKGHPEWAPILPSNPYSASKAAQEATAIAYWRTYGVPVTLINCMNMIGERQDVEKFVPMVISKILKDETVTIHASKTQDSTEIGTRHYLHARNLADALLFLLQNVKPAMFPAHASAYEEHVAERPDRFNVASPDRIDNLTIAKLIAETIGKTMKFKLEDFHSTRPGHDPHYGLDPSKLLGLGWRMPVPFDESLDRTVRWTIAHQDWLLSD